MTHDENLANLKRRVGCKTTRALPNSCRTPAEAVPNIKKQKNGARIGLEDKLYKKSV